MPLIQRKHRQLLGPGSNMYMFLYSTNVAYFLRQTIAQLRNDESGSRTSGFRFSSSLSVYALKSDDKQRFPAWELIKWGYMKQSTTEQPLAMLQSSRRPHPSGDSGDSDDSMRWTGHLLLR
jgi:hypothetical protein